ncbi:MORN repeat protein [Pacmanvirus A23]|uniref:MORN repeat protein n=1 Tax=Pacmanvirus A23 TaxID=1932881 RepID=UPI000A0958CC|nr:MORN repeat protein [Pacmanvirus A23]SIP85995.1 MORN repeat protein [Pacmanvirus A23]
MQSLVYLCCVQVVKNTKISIGEFSDCEEIKEQLFKILKPIDQLTILGEVKKFHTCGNTKSHIKFSGDKRHGLHLEWYPDGKLKKKGNFDNGVEHGEVCLWYENGNKKLLCNYVFGKQNGEKIHWDSFGRITSKHFFKDDKLHGPVIVYRARDTIYSNFREGYRHGELKYVNSAGKITRHDLYINGIRVMSYLE